MSERLIYSGVGGLSYGFAHNDYFEIVTTSEILPNMAKAYSLNRPTAKICVEDTGRKFSPQSPSLMEEFITNWNIT